MFSAVAATLQLRLNAASSLYNLTLDKVAQSESRGHFLAASLAVCAKLWFQMIQVLLVVQYRRTDVLYARPMGKSD